MNGLLGNKQNVPHADIENFLMPVLYICKQANTPLPISASTRERKMSIRCIIKHYAVTISHGSRSVMICCMRQRNIFNWNGL